MRRVCLPACPARLTAIFLMGAWVLLWPSSGLRAAADGQAPDDPLAETPALPYLTVMLARDRAVQAELRLTSKQAAEVEAAVAAVDNPMWLLRDVPVKQCADKLNRHLAQFQLSLNRTLSPPQQERLQGIMLQSRGAKALVSPEIAERLQLTEQQVAQLRKQITDLQHARKKSDQPTATASSAARTKPDQAESKLVLSTLSRQQQNKLAALVGSRFDLSQVRKVGCVAPELTEVSEWINSEPLTFRSLRGKVVVVHFWAFGCINCIHNLPHYKLWRETFPEQDVAIIGIHTPETEAERSPENLRSKTAEYRITYPVAFDLAAANWKLWANNMWPSVYLVDRRGQVRGWWYGELNWEGAHGEEAMRRQIQQLVAEK